MSEFHYPGEELDVFERARNWKGYWAGKLEPFLGKRILEVGAGIGANTTTFKEFPYTKWHCIEPDGSLYQRLIQRRQSGEINPLVKISQCTALELDEQEAYDSILYIDVLEHIEDDRRELSHSASLLSREGSIVILSPAHNWLYSEFDRMVGHHRRYNRTLLRNIVPEGMKITRIQYLDSIGLFASLANKLILKSATPSVNQVVFWDRVMVPFSRAIDPLLLNLVGKSVFAVLQKE